MLRFMIQYGSMVSELSRLTGLRFINTPIRSKKPIERSVKRILYLHNKRNFQERDLLLAKLVFLVKNLQKIEKSDIVLFNKLKKQLLKSINENEYFGSRFEISVAASLISKNITFKKRESADFIISVDQKESFIECTSSHITVLKGDFKQKLVDQITEKALKPYCNLQTALFVDITNIYCMRILEDNSITGKDLSNYFAKVLLDTDFGSLMFFVFIANLDKNTFGTSYIRIDNPKINTSLRDFLDLCYPIEKIFINRCWIPHEG
jgi:hypothetical protein